MRSKTKKWQFCERCVCTRWTGIYLAIPFARAKSICAHRKIIYPLHRLINTLFTKLKSHPFQHPLHLRISVATITKTNKSVRNHFKPVALSSQLSCRHRKLLLLLLLPPHSMWWQNDEHEIPNQFIFIILSSLHIWPPLPRYVFQFLLFFVLSFRQFMRSWINSLGLFMLQSFHSALMCWTKLFGDRVAGNLYFIQAMYRRCRKSADFIETKCEFWKMCNSPEIWRESTGFEFCAEKCHHIECPLPIVTATFFSPFFEDIKNGCHLATT